MTMSIRAIGTAGVLCGLLLAGCGETSTSETAAKPNGPSKEGEKLLLSSAPAEALEVKAAREEAATDEEVVVVGRIGGSVDPWVEGLAAFTVVDNSLKACSDIPGDKCPTPWDYCCESSVGQSRTLVKFVDESGAVIDTDARELLGVSELQTVFVKGKAQRDADGNLSLLATGIYVQPESGLDHDHSTGDGHDHDHEHHDGEEGHGHDHDHEGHHDDETSES